MPDVEPQGAQELRQSMVDRIVRRFELQSLELLPAVERALRKVPRHLFTEGASLEDSYGDGAVITNRDGHGAAVSSVSAAWLQAMQLCQARLTAGDRLLEVGSGGYNAALAREVVGAGGSVTSVDIDPAVTERALRCLASAGYPDVAVIRDDAANLVPGQLFDKIVVTVGAWDISPAWLSHLVGSGRLVVPLRTMGVTRSWELERAGEGLVSRSRVVCGFVPIRGEGAGPGRSIPLSYEPRVELWCDEEPVIGGAGLAGVLDEPRAEVWTGVTVGLNESFSDQDLWLATTLPGYCPLMADAEALSAGIVDLAWPYGSPAFVRGRTFAYRPRNRAADKEGTRFEFGAVAHGPDRAWAAPHLAEQIVAWDQAGRPAPVLSVHPAGSPDAALPKGFVLDKRHTRLVISWLCP